MEPALVLIGNLVVLAVSTPVAVRAWRRRRANRAARRVTIGDAPEGVRVRVVGTVADVASLRAPMTGRRCAGYHVVIEERIGQHWMWRAEQREGRELVIDDATGRAIGELTAAAISDEISVRVGRATATDPIVLAMMARSRLPDAPRGQLRWRERALEVGTPVAVVGLAVREPDPDAVRRVTGYRAGPPTRLRFTGSTARPVVVSDDFELQE